MIRASYTEAVNWIAANDGAGDEDALQVSAVKSQLTCGLVAAIFGVSDDKVALDVVRARGGAQPAPRVSKLELFCQQLIMATPASGLRWCPGLSQASVKARLDSHGFDLLTMQEGARFRYAAVQRRRS